MSHSKNVQAEKSNSEGSIIICLRERLTNIKKIDGNNLLAKDKALKILTLII